MDCVSFTDDTTGRLGYRCSACDFAISDAKLSLDIVSDLNVAFNFAESLITDGEFDWSYHFPTDCYVCPSEVEIKLDFGWLLSQIPNVNVDLQSVLGAAGEEVDFLWNSVFGDMCIEVGFFPCNEEIFVQFRMEDNIVWTTSFSLNDLHFRFLQ